MEDNKINKITRKTNRQVWIILLIIEEDREYEEVTNYCGHSTSDMKCYIYVDECDKNECNENAFVKWMSACMFVWVYLVKISSQKTIIHSTYSMKMFHCDIVDDISHPLMINKIHLPPNECMTCASDLTFPLDYLNKGLVSCKLFDVIGLSGILKWACNKFR